MLPKWLLLCFKQMGTEKANTGEAQAELSRSLEWIAIQELAYGKLRVHLRYRVAGNTCRCGPGLHQVPWRPSPSGTTLISCFLKTEAADTG